MGRGFYMTEKKLYRSKNYGMFGGVCAGIGQHLNIDIFTVRVITVFLIFGSGISMLLLYIILCFLIPAEPEVIDHPDRNEKLIE